MDNFSMQNVKDLEIPEGNVRTIHDSGGTQLWGMVAYDTKYAGDATQAGTPTPDSPQAINVVKGTQTITLTDGVVSDDFTVDLGSIELAKVGTYQDYIYKSGGDWYVHKAINKGVINGSEDDWGYQNGVFRRFFDDAMRDINAVLVMSDYFTGQTTRYRDDISNLCCAKITGANSQIGFRYDAMNSDVPTWRSWLSTHNTTIYYVLATPTDTQITDATLITQLDAIHEWLTRYGYQSSVVGSLPIIISQTNL